MLFFGIGMKTDLFQSCGHCWLFQICWHIECSTFTPPSFRIWNSSTGIPSPPLALCVVILPKAHLASHFRMSDSRWVIIPSWFSGLRRFFSYSSLNDCHLFSISSVSVRSITFLSFIVLIFAWNILLVSMIFLKRSLDFPIVLFPSISLHWSLRRAFLSLLAPHWNSAFRWAYPSFFPLLFDSLLWTPLWPWHVPWCFWQHGGWINLEAWLCGQHHKRKRDRHRETRRQWEVGENFPDFMNQQLAVKVTGIDCDSFRGTQLWHLFTEMCQCHAARTPLGMTCILVRPSLENTMWYRIWESLEQSFSPLS